MSGDAQLQVQKALYDALSAALAPVKVYDHVPQGTAFPYCVIGEGEVNEFDTDTEFGQDHRLLIHIFDRNRGKAPVKEILRKVRDALDAQPLTLESGAALVHIHFEFAEVFVEENDGLTYHGVTRYRALTTEA